MKKSFFRKTSSVALSTLASRILGFIRDRVIAGMFGTGPHVDAFVVAFTIPNFFRRFVAEGSLTVSFVPVFTEYLELRGAQQARALAYKTLSLLFMAVLSLTVCGIIFSPQIVSLFGKGFTDPQIVAMTVFLTRLMFPYLLLICMVAFCMGYLNSLGHFFAPAISPVFLNIGMIGAALFLAPLFEEPMTALAIGVVGGGVIQLLIQIPYMIRYGFKFKFEIDLREDGVRKILKMMGAALPGGAAVQSNILINRMLASMLPAGSISYLYFCDRLTEMVIGIFVVSIGSVLLPEMSRISASNDISALKKMVRGGVLSSLYFAVPAAFALFAAGRLIVYVLFQGGKFDEVSTQNTYMALMVASFGVIFIAMHKILTQAFYSLKNTKVPVITSFAALAVNASSGYFLMQTPLKHAGLALASNLAMVVQVVLLFIILRIMTGSIGFRTYLLPLLKLFTASGLMAVFLFFAQRYAEGYLQSFPDSVIFLVFLVITGGFLYFSLTFLLRVDESRALVNMVVKRFSRA